MVDIYDQFKDFKSFEVIFNNKNGKPQTLFCSVKSIENNRLIIDSNNQRNNNIFAEVGDELKLYIYTENGIYSATSKVLLVTKGMLNTEYIIAYPANSKHSQRREYFRAEMNVDFKMQAEFEKNLVLDITSKTRNICGKGMSFVSDNAFPENDKITVVLSLKEKVVETSATLVYSKQIVFGGNPKFVHAFMFTDISQKDIDFVVKQCFLHQLDLRKRQQAL